MQSQRGQGDGASAVPPLPALHFSRPALIDALDAAARSPLTVVSGGPGWGKTTAVAEWARRRDACWVTLNARDTDPARLANRILAALRRRLPDLPAGFVIASRPAGDGRPRAPVAAIVTALSDLLADRPGDDLVLVLDGLHRLPADGESIRLVAGLTHQMPLLLHLVVITESAEAGSVRWPGLAGWPEPARLSGPAEWQVSPESAVSPVSAESAGSPESAVSAQWPALAVRNAIGPDQLAFSVPEVAAFLHAALGWDDPAAAKEVWELTSGWPAAVRLAAEALRTGAAGAADILPHLRTRGMRMLDALAAQVLSAEPEPVRRLLAAAAILGSVDVPLCEALGHAQAATLLPVLGSRGLARADGTDGAAWSAVGPVRDLLTRIGSVDPAQVREIRTRAAAYHADRDEHGAALRCLAAAGDRSGVEQLLLAHGEKLVAEGEAAAVLSAAGAVDLRSTDRAVLAVLGHARQLTGDWMGALELLRAAAAGAGRLGPALALRLGQILYVSGQVEEAVATFDRSRIDDGAPRDDDIRLLCAAAVWLRAVGEDDRASATASRAAAAAERSADPVSLARSHWALALLAAHAGDRPAHDIHHRHALRLASQAGDRLLRLGLQINHASYLAEEGAPAEAAEEAEAALRLGRDLQIIGYEPLCYTIRARARARLGRFAEALADLDASQRQWQDMGPSIDIAFGQIVRGDIHNRRGEPGQAQAALAEAVRHADTVEMRPMQPLALAAHARATAANDLDAARKLADQAVAAATGTGTVPALLARGWVALLAGDREEAGSDAARARSVAGSRRDHGGLAEALELAVLAAPDRHAAAGLLQEAGTLWAELDDPVGQARVQLIRARLAGPAGQPMADTAAAALRRHGVLLDSGVADALAVPVPTRPISVDTLGTFQVRRDGTAVPAAAWRSKKARNLFKILIARRGRPIPREQVTTLLWPDDHPDRTANRLSVLLSTLRTVLDPEHTLPQPGPVIADRDKVALNLDLILVDLETFLDLAAAARTAERTGDPAAGDLLAAAADAYTGEFLPDSLYEEWAEPLRSTARSTHIAVLRSLLRQTADPARLERYLLQLLEHDPYDEQIHRQLIAALYAAGRHGEARQRHDEYTARMAEIGVTPPGPGSPRAGGRP